MHQTYQKDQRNLPLYAKVKICELKKLDSHLYKFIVNHPDRKYIDYHECIQDIKNLGVVLTVRMIEGKKKAQTQLRIVVYCKWPSVQLKENTSFLFYKYSN